MVTTLYYPRLEMTPAEVFSQEYLNRVTALVKSWQQGPGSIGALHLHSCWGKTSVLGKRYHGITAATSWPLMNAVLTLHRQTRADSWSQMADEIVSNVLYLQSPEGGFVHASGEFEPTYTCRETCPIHQGMPILALLAYAGAEGADPRLLRRIRPAIDRHWQWFHGEGWRRGNQWSGPLPCGWCGVTNQDLTIVAALAFYGKIFGDWSRYEQFGKPVLDRYLGPAYYYDQLGLFERGDKPHFVERTNYFDVILEMLEIIRLCTGDAGILSVETNIVNHLQDAAYRGEDGLTYLAWGAETAPEDQARVTGWIRSPCVVGALPGLVRAMRHHQKVAPSSHTAALIAELEKTMAAWTYSDGMLPGALNSEDPIMSIVPSSEIFRIWLNLIERLGDGLTDPVQIPIPEGLPHFRLPDFSFRPEPVDDRTARQAQVCGLEEQSVRDCDWTRRTLARSDLGRGGRPGLRRDD